MDKTTLALVAKISAIEMLLPGLFFDVYSLRGLTRADVVARHNKLRDMFQSEGVPGADPAMSDLLSGELEDATESILAAIEARFE